MTATKLQHGNVRRSPILLPSYTVASRSRQLTRQLVNECDPLGSKVGQI